MLKKELRQNFTIDKNVLFDVSNTLNLAENDRIIEIGPGKGVLSLMILKKATDLNDFSILSYEVDEDLRDDLEYIKRKWKNNFDYRIQNFLEAKPKVGFNKCTGNIPYHISEPLFFKFIDWDFEEIVMITGIKFARKVAENQDSKISIISKYLFDSIIVKEYDKNIFFPKSKVDSALLVMKKRQNFENEKDRKVAHIFKNIFKKHIWLNKYLGYEQSQIGQIYHMDLEKLISEIN